MIIQSIYLQEGFYERKIIFSNTVNLIHSNKNSAGKTTLLRLILYGLGYDIPNTRNMNFNRCLVEIDLILDNNQILKLYRTNRDYIVAEANGQSRTFTLPDQENELHSILFNTVNSDILKNILGAFYVDQEKGWTLLNRGVVIGSIHFNVEELVRGISDLNCSDLINRLQRLQSRKSKLKEMVSVSQYKDKLQQESGTLLPVSSTDEADAEIAGFQVQLESLNNELHRVDKILADNRQTKQFIEDMQLLLELPDGQVIPIKAEHIQGLNDSIELLVTKRKMLAADIKNINRNILAHTKFIDKENEQLSMLQDFDQTAIFDRKIAELPISTSAINDEIKRIDKEIKAVQDELTEKTYSNNQSADEIGTDLIAYIKELDLDKDGNLENKYLFTSNLKELTGAVLQKMAFAFRLAYIKAIEKKCSIKLPILLDSPRGRELDEENIELMMNLLKRDFSGNQIIIASIYSYSMFDNCKIVETKDRLIDQVIAN